MHDDDEHYHDQELDNYDRDMPFLVKVFVVLCLIFLAMFTASNSNAVQFNYLPTKVGTGLSGNSYYETSNGAGFVTSEADLEDCDLPQYTPVTLDTELNIIFYKKLESYIDYSEDELADEFAAIEKLSLEIDQ